MYKFPLASTYDTVIYIPKEIKNFWHLLLPTCYSYVYRYHHDLLPPGLPNNHFPTQANVHDYYTRQANDLHVDPTNTKLAQNNIKTQGPLTWNKLNIKIKNSPSLASFKTNLKKHILDQYEFSTIDTKYYAPTSWVSLSYGVLSPSPAPSFDIQFFSIFIFSVFHDIIHTVYL